MQGQKKGRERFYTLTPETWTKVVGRGQPLPLWTNWPAVFAALESIWFTVTDAKMEERGDLMLGADLNGLVREIALALTRGGVPHQLEPRPIENTADYVNTTFRELSGFVSGIV